MQEDTLFSNLQEMLSKASHSQSKKFLQKIQKWTEQNIKSKNKKIRPKKTRTKDNDSQNIQENTAAKLPITKQKIIKKPVVIFTEKYLQKVELKERIMRISLERRIHQFTKQAKNLKESDSGSISKLVPFEASQGDEQEHKQSQEDSLQSKDFDKELLLKQYLEKTISIKNNFNSYLLSKSPEPRSDELTCAICIEILIEPVSTACGHSFCYSCLDQCLLFGSTCPVCRLSIKGMDLVPCKTLSKLIEVKFKEYINSKEGIELYQKRTQTFQEWKQKRLLKADDFELGMNIDVRDTENIWCEGDVEKLFYVSGKLSSVLVHYKRWAKIYNQVIEIQSSRLAPYQLFSSRTDIPRYNLNNDQQNVRGSVIRGAMVNQQNQNNRFDFFLNEIDDDLQVVRERYRRINPPPLQFLRRRVNRIPMISAPVRPFSDVSQSSGASDNQQNDRERDILTISSDNDEEARALFENQADQPESESFAQQPESGQSVWLSLISNSEMSAPLELQLNPENDEVPEQSGDEDQNQEPVSFSVGGVIDSLWRDPQYLLDDNSAEGDDLNLNRPAQRMEDSNSYNFSEASQHSEMLNEANESEQFISSQIDFLSESQN